MLAPHFFFNHINVMRSQNLLNNLLKLYDLLFFGITNGNFVAVSKKGNIL